MKFKLPKKVDWILVAIFCWLILLTIVQVYKHIQLKNSIIRNEPIKVDTEKINRLNKEY
jgi:hypothetical protein